MSRTGWKAFERRCADYFGSTRTPLSGGNSGHTRSDSLHERLYIECKSNANWKILSDWNKLKTKAKRWKNADGKQKVPTVFMVWQGLVVFHSDNPPDLPVKPTLWSLVEDTRCTLLYTQETAITRLFMDTYEKAIIEGKTPLLALGQMNRPGFWIVCGLQDVTDILNER